MRGWGRWPKGTVRRLRQTQSGRQWGAGDRAMMGLGGATGPTGLWDSAREGGWGRTSVKKVEDNFSIIYEVVKKPLS